MYVAFLCFLACVALCLSTMLISWRDRCVFRALLAEREHPLEMQRELSRQRSEKRQSQLLTLEIFNQNVRNWITAMRPSDPEGIRDCWGRPFGVLPQFTTLYAELVNFLRAMQFLEHQIITDKAEEEDILFFRAWLSEFAERFQAINADRKDMQAEICLPHMASAVPLSLMDIKVELDALLDRLHKMHSTRPYEELTCTFVTKPYHHFEDEIYRLYEIVWWIEETFQVDQCCQQSSLAFWKGFIEALRGSITKFEKEEQRFFEDLEADMQVFREYCVGSQDWRRDSLSLRLQGMMHIVDVMVNDPDIPNSVVLPYSAAIYRQMGRLSNLY